MPEGVALQVKPGTPKIRTVSRFTAIPTPSVRSAAMLPASLVGFVYGMAGIFSSGGNHKTPLKEGAFEACADLVK